MPSLSTHPAGPPAEVSHTSRAPSFIARSSKRRQYLAWNLATWNVRSVLDVEGSVETARQGREVSYSEDRKIDRVVGEMQRYKVYIGALQETKWFGSESYKVGDSIVLTSGRPTPQPGQSGQRGEGVALVLSGPAKDAWKAGGQQWRSWNSRLISAAFGKPGSGSDRLHVLSCYAPTFAASRVEKDQFFDSLQQALDDVPSSECYVVLGDFNARVGSRVDVGEDWEGVRGPHGFGEVNEAGKELLTFLSLNEATVCNTWFEKKRIHKQTWQHPKSKRWHCIDYAITRQVDNNRCLDAAVKRGAECNTDHQMLQVRLKMTKQIKHHKGGKRSEKLHRFDVSKLHGRRVDENGKITTRGCFQDGVCTKVKELWKNEGTVEEKWTAIRSALTETAQSVLGKENRRHPDWFKECADELKPFFERRNDLYNKWLSSGKEEDRLKFAKARNDAKRNTRKAKNKWFQQKATEAQNGRHGGKLVWRCIRDMQCGRRGLVPVKSAVIRDETGQPCRTPQSTQQRWRRHFQEVLNMHSQFNAAEMEQVRQRPLRPHMAEPPSKEELLKAVGKLQNGKAGGCSGILPEMM